MSNKKVNKSENSVHGENNQRETIKRSLSSHSSDDDDDKKKKSETTSRRYKSLLICVVCDGDAHGYNFDAITCESCKAFFRRNAMRPVDKLKCRSNGRCNVRCDVEKRCKKCRLEKCVTTGMRKEWIQSEKEREEKRAKIEANRRLRQGHDSNHPIVKKNSTTDNDLSLDLSTLLDPSLFNDFDSFRIYVIREHYIEAVKLTQIIGISSYPCIQPVESTSDLFRVPLYISSMRLTTYVKRIDEFQQLTHEDQIHLIKLNLLTTCFFHSIYIYDPRNDCYHEENTTDPLFSGKDWSKTLSKQFHAEMKQLRCDLIDIFQLDDVIIKLFLLILLFSNQMSSNQSSTCTSTNVNSLDIFKAQNVFIDLVYKYCLHEHGPRQASLLFSRYVHKIMKIQQLVDGIKYTIDSYMDIREASSLIQSLLE